jgi:transcriptional regulator with XRE-family HTH domain
MDTAGREPAQPAQPSFGALLRQYRLTAGLSQEALAERAGLSVAGLSALENGRRKAPYRHTVLLLARGLGLSAAEIARLDAAIVRGRVPAPTAVPAREVPDRATTPAGEAAGDTSPRQSARTNLPVALTSFIGREHEQGEVQALLDVARLVTLTGAGGAGKTCLALAVAGELVGHYADGVWLVELAALADPALVPGAVAQVLGVHEDPRRDLQVVLADFLRERHLLLLLDNCEHLLAACALLASRLLRACPALHILATSREGLGLAGEQLYRVPSLSVPDPRHLPPPDLVGSYEAVRLFVARARDRRPDFTLSAQNARAVAQICARLDGLPLAIELAAARVGAMSVEAIAARLDDRFRLLTGGARDALPRQQTLRATLDWSYDLLGAGERLLLGRLAVFAGAGRWTRRRRSAPAMGWTRAPSSTCWTAWCTSRWCRWRTYGTRCATGCWRRSGSTRGSGWTRGWRRRPWRSMGGTPPITGH